MENIENNPIIIQQISEKGSAAVVPVGNSMWPTLKNRGQTVIIGKKPERLKPLDVAIFRRKNGNFVMHRVMEVKDGYCIMCGDSQFVREKVDADSIFGVMLGFYEGKKYVSCDDPEYIKRVEKLFSDEKKRKRRVKRYFFFLNLASLPKRAFNKIFRRKRKEKENG